ncbi:MAG: protein kinase [Myxococcota bacterium]
MAPRPEHDPQGIGPGTVIGERYRVIRLLGEGGMGRVFLADDQAQGGQVALKVLADDRPIPRAAERFTREARSIARIDHDNVVRILDVGHSPQVGLYYAMEFLEGEELADTLVREGPMPWPRAVAIALQVCSALQAAHEKAVVHRDLKLENCFLVERDGETDFIKILDFGVAKLLAPDGEHGGRLTNTGATLGTPAYMAPELCRGKGVDHRVDVYALGVMLYELLTGTVPFDGESFLDVALQHMNDPPPPLTEHLPGQALPPGLEAAVMRALAKVREDRFPTMASFARALRKVTEDVAYDVDSSSRVGEPTGEAAGTRPGWTAPYGGAPSRRVSPGRAPDELSGRTVRVPESASDSSAMGSEIPSTSASGETPGRTIHAPATVSSDEPSGGTVPSLPAWPSEEGTPSTGTMPLLASADDELCELGPPRRRLSWVVVGLGVSVALALMGWWLTQPDDLEPQPEQVEATQAEVLVVAPRSGLRPESPVESPVESPAETSPGESAGSGSTGSEPASAGRPRRSRRLSRAQLDRGFAGVAPRVKACGGPLMGSKPGDRVLVQLRIDRSTGRVTSVRVRTDDEGSAVRSCVKDAVKKATFAPAGTGVQVVSRWFTL